MPLSEYTNEEIHQFRTVFMLTHIACWQRKEKCIKSRPFKKIPQTLAARKKMLDVFGDDELTDIQINPNDYHINMNPYQLNKPKTRKRKTKCWEPPEWP